MDLPVDEIFSSPSEDDKSSSPSATSSDVDVDSGSDQPPKPRPQNAFYRRFCIRHTIMAKNLVLGGDNVDTELVDDYYKEMTKLEFRPKNKRPFSKLFTKAHKEGVTDELFSNFEHEEVIVDPSDRILGILQPIPSEGQNPALRTVAQAAPVLQEAAATRAPTTADSPLGTLQDIPDDVADDKVQLVPTVGAYEDLPRAEHSHDFNHRVLSGRITKTSNDRRHKDELRRLRERDR
ncbi:hypothetical protein F5Y16DRAFT_397724 [Xylariaceae sp. FL0255]|nr:hypothetical protein F5Y16DRAFT_397724 [Xylariaceae sp. FL0255]